MSVFIAYRYCKVQVKDAFEIQKPKTLIMGWSSWNNFRININEDVIKPQADFMMVFL